MYSEIKYQNTNYKLQTKLSTLLEIESFDFGGVIKNFNVLKTPRWKKRNLQNQLSLR